MLSNRLPIILLALALGIFSYQFIMRPTVAEQSFKRRFLIGHADIAEDATTPENAMKTKIRQQSLPPVGQVVGLGAKPQSLAVEAPAVVPSPAASPINIQALAVATDEKNKDLSKKKKRKKKSVSATPAAQPKSFDAFNAPVPTQAKEAFAPAPVAASLPTYKTNYANPSNVTSNNNHHSQGAQYWEDILLKEANPAAVQNFLAMNKTKQVSDDVVYEVGSAMAADKRPAIRQLGIVIFGATNSLRNFEALVHILDSEAAQSTLVTDATKYLTTYSNVSNEENMTILAAALKAPNTTPSLHIEALKLVDVASKQYAVLAFNQTTDQTNNLTNNQANAGIEIFSVDHAHKIFDPFVIILTSFLQSSQDANTKAVASQDMSDIQSLIGPQQNASINP
jgi:hypothetical protein